MSKTIYDLIDIAWGEEETNEAVFEGIKPAIDIYNELANSHVTAMLSFHGGIKLSNILNKLQAAIMARGGITEEEETDETVVTELESMLTEQELTFLYGIYLLS